jgi:multisubunit Na+/H+ antiporter MnhE subunit
MPPRSSRARSGPPTARLWFFLAWAAGSMVLWMLLTSTVKGSELVAGAIAAVVTAVVVEAVRERERFAFRPRLRWLRRAVAIPVRVVVESWQVTVALTRHATGRTRVRGTFVAIPFEHGERDDPEAAARRALVTVGVSMTPNTVVVGIDPDRNELLTHQLVPDPASLERAVHGA